MELYAIDSVPDWVIERTLTKEKVTSEQYSGSPFYYLLVDFQEKLSADKFESYFRAVEKVNDSSRIEDASLISREFSQENERIIFNFCKIIRGEEEIDVLDEENIRTFQRETSLEQHITNGKMTFSLSIDDLRVGDILDYSYTIEEIAGSHPLIGKFYIANYWLNWVCPVISQYVRLINLSSNKLTLQLCKTVNYNTKMETSEIAPSETKEFSFSNLNRSNIDKNSPNWITADYLNISTKDTWQGVSKYLYDFYLTKETFDSINLESVEGLSLFGEKKKDIISIVRFVQDQIRYKGENKGIYSHTPKKPSITLKKRSGDCKDKSNLLLALLKCIDVEATLLLVNSTAGRVLPEKSASPYQFDHMIVEVAYDKKKYYFDPTIQKQRGDLGHTVDFFYGWGLPVNKRGSDIINLPLDLNKLVFDLHHIFHFSTKKNVENTLEINRKYYSHRADNVRFYVNSKERTVLEGDFLESAKSDTGLELEIDEPYTVIRDDEVLNEIETKEKYIIKDIEITHKNKRVELSTDFHHDLPKEGSGNYPLFISLDGNLKHIVDVFYQQKIGAHPAERKIIQNKNFVYNDMTQQEAKRVTLASSITLKDDIVKEEDVKSFLTDVESVIARSNNSFIWSKSKLNFSGSDWFWLTFCIIGVIVFFMRFLNID